MASCPNVNLEEWKALEAAVGKFEAYRDYIETNGDIRSPEVVLAKLESRAQQEQIKAPSEFSENPSIEELRELTQNEETVPETITRDGLKRTRAMELADKMSFALGIDYEVITPEEAMQITENSKNPWNGEAAFFFGGRVYLLQGRLTTDNVLHEFAHPFVRAIAKENTELFNNLYDKLAATVEGQDIIEEVKEMYPELELTEESELFKEEVIVKALEKHGREKVQNIQPKGKFAQAVNEILYALKQLLRKVFGKSIKISKLNTDTTINELADIITKGGQIEINTELVSDEDVVAYNRENYEEITEGFDALKAKDLQDTINLFYDSITKQVNELYNNKNYRELIPILKDEYLRGDLEEIKANLKKYQTMIKSAKDRFNEDVIDTKGRAMAMTDTLLRLDDIMAKMYEHMQYVLEEGDTQENMHKAYYYGKFISAYQTLIDDLNLAMRKNGVPAGSAIRTTVASIKANMDNTEDIVRTMRADGARDALYEQLEPMNRAVSERYEQILKNLEKSGASPKKIDKVYKEYHGMSKAEYTRFKSLSRLNKEQGLSTQEELEFKALTLKSRDGLSVSKEKIEALLKGDAGDANVFSSYLEGYLYNNDPIIGGLALYTKNALNEVMIVAQQKYNAFAEELRDPLKRAGFNPTLLGRLGERTTFKDIVAIKKADGTIEKREVHTFLNRFQNHRYEREVKRQAVEDAHEMYLRNNDEESYRTFLDAVADQKKFLRDYFHQEYVDEFYDKDELLSMDDTGKEAAYLRGEIFDRMSALTQPNKSQMDDIAIADEIDQLWREYAQLHSRFYADGSVKIGKDAAIASRLREYRESSREFYEWKERKGVFENQYFNFLQELRNKNIEENSDEWKKAIDDWKRVNSRKVVKNEFYEERNEILEEIREIMDKLPEAARKDLDQSAVWEDIIDKSSGYRDHDNQLNATEMSEKTIADIKVLQQRLEEIREAGIQVSGLTREEEQTLSELYEKSKTDKTVWPQINALNQKKKDIGLSKFDVNRLSRLYKDLSELSSKEATAYYVEQTNAVLDKIEGLHDTKFYKNYKSSNITADSANLLLDVDTVEELSKISPEFAEWHAKNHIKKKKYNKETKTLEDVYERLYVWSITKPSDPAMMESYEIRDAAGKVVDTVQGLPSLKFYTRVVKEKYRNRSIRGVTKDNQGKWLPKTMEDGAVDDRFQNKRYYDLKNSTNEQDKALFEVLEIMTRNHLDNQEGLSYRNRLGYDVPRYRRDPLEVVREFTKNPTKAGKKKFTGLTILMKRFKDFFQRTADQVEDGYSYENDFNLIRADIFDNEMTDIPISGLYDIDIDDVSMDVTTSINRYMLSAERQKQLVKISPVVRAIQSTVNEPEFAVKDINKIHQRNFKATNLLKYIPKKDNVRKKAVNNWIEKHFEGKTQTGLGSESAFLNNFSNLLFKRASFSFFAMNIPSALKNSLGMKFQSMLEASGGQFVSHRTLQMGNGWAYVTMGELSFTNQLYTRGARSHNQQLVEIFDPIQDRFEEKFGQGISRTAAKDAASMNWLFSFRKWVEIQANLQLFGGMMYKKMVTIQTEDGPKEIPYMKAFETVDGQIRLKEGIDVRYGIEPIYHVLSSTDTVESIAQQYNIPVEEAQEVFENLDIEAKLEAVEELEFDREAELADVDLDKAEDDLEYNKLLEKQEAINNKYDNLIREKGSVKIDNTEFKFMKNRIQQVVNNMGGAYNKFDQPEAQRYLAFRWVSFLRRYFTTMAVNRWGFRGPLWDPKPRLNPGMGEVHMGFYIQFAKTMLETITSLGSNLPHLQAYEKQAALKFAFEVTALILLTQLMGLLFGWDPEDDDRFKKLRAMSGALPGPGVEGKEGREFDAMGWLELHSLHLMMQVRAENEQFNLITGGTAPYTSLLSLKGIALGPTVESYQTIWGDLKGMYKDDPKAYYKRDVGPMAWQKKGDAKFYNHFMKMFGVTGKQYDPAKAIENFQSFYVRSQK